MKITFSLLLILLIGTGIAQDKSKTITIKVKPYMTLSYGAFFKNLELKSPDCGAEHISGFDFEWGYKYSLKVKETTLARPPEDGSSKTYKLIKVISKTKVAEDYTFKMSIERDIYLGPGDQKPTLVKDGENNYKYFGKINILYDAKFQRKFDQLMDSDSMRLQGTFKFGKEGTIEVVSF
ncbi:MAG: hypothetical protein ACI9J3_000863 [Parvicellaceae bacterium]|jgi:hypothetical protein